MALPLESLITLGVLLLGLSAWLVQHYASPGTSILINLLVTLSFWLGFGGIALLPIDLSLTKSYEADAVGENANETYTLWLATYWSTFFLAWAVLPLVRETLLSGQFTVVSKLRAGCRVSLWGYATLLLILSAVVILLAIRLRSWHVVPVLMALGNTYGLLLVSLLLGYGLVDLPRRMWRQAMPESELKRIRIMAGAADEALFEAVWELQDCEDLVDASVSKIERYEREEYTAPGHTPGNTPVDAHYKTCVDALVRRRDATANLSRPLQRRRTSHHRRHTSDHENESSGDGRAPNDTGGVPSLDYLADLNARFERAQARLVSTEQRWNALVQQSKFLADLADGTVPVPSESGVPPSAPFLLRAHARLSSVRGRVRFLWITLLRRPAYRLFAISSAALSGMVLWSEATLSIPINLSPFALILGMLGNNSDSENGVLFQIAALVPLLYMSACVYSSMFKLTLFGPYCLRGYKQSVGVALVFNAQYLVRLQFPLGYNYLLMLKYDTSSTNCAFSQVMSDMSTVPFFGTSFSVYAPLLILALCGFTLCDGYPRLLAALGIEHEDAILMGDQETLDGKVNEGITLLRRHAERDEPESPNGDDEKGNEPNQSTGSSWWYGVV